MTALLGTPFNCIHTLNFNLTKELEQVMIQVFKYCIAWHMASSKASMCLNSIFITASTFKCAIKNHT